MRSPLHSENYHTVANVITAVPSRLIFRVASGGEGVFWSLWQIQIDPNGKVAEGVRLKAFLGCTEKGLVTCINLIL